MNLSNGNVIKITSIDNNYILKKLKKLLENFTVYIFVEVVRIFACV